MRSISMSAPATKRRAYTCKNKQNVIRYIWIWITFNSPTFFLPPTCAAHILEHSNYMYWHFQLLILGNKFCVIRTDKYVWVPRAIFKLIAE